MSQEINWSEVDPEVTDFVFYQAEKYLEAQITCGTASDARAITAASILAGLSSLVLASTLGNLGTAQPVSLVPAGLALGASLMIAAILCYQAARPVDFHAAGNQPDMWWDCLDAPLNTSKGHEVENYQQKIVQNESILDQSAKQLGRGMNLAFMSPLIAAAIFCITYSFS